MAGRRLALVVLVGLAATACGSDQRVAPSVAASVAAVAPDQAARPSPPATAGAIVPAAVSVVEVVQLAGGETDERVVAVMLSGGAGLTAAERRLEIRVWTEPIADSSCEAPPVPSVLTPGHPDAVQPHLADATRTVRVHSTGGQPAPGPGQAATGEEARFRYGPVPSLNGDFEGWVSFHLPSASVDGFCAFDLRGEVTLTASGTATVELPTTRIDSRDRLDGS